MEYRYSTDYTVLQEAIECRHCNVAIVPELSYAAQIPSHGNLHIVAFVSCVDSSCKLPFLLEFELKYNPKDRNWRQKPFSLLEIYNYEYESSIPEDLKALRDDKTPLSKEVFRNLRARALGPRTWAYKGIRYGISKIL